MDEFVTHLLEIQVVRFLCVGVAGTLLYYAIYTPLIRIVHYLLAATLAFVPSFCFGFAAHKIWTFGNDSLGGAWEQLSLFSLKKALFFGLNALLLYYLVECRRFHPLYGQCITTCVLGIGSFFITQWIFRQ